MSGISIMMGSINHILGDFDFFLSRLLSWTKERKVRVKRAKVRLSERLSVGETIELSYNDYRECCLFPVEEIHHIVSWQHVWIFIVF